MIPRFAFPLTACAALLAASCASTPIPWEGSGPIYIGFCADLSASRSEEGISARDGALLELEEVNAGGGIGGRDVRLLCIDVAQSPAEAVGAYSELAQRRGVCAVIGPQNVDSCLALAPVAELVKVPVVSHCRDDRLACPELDPAEPDSPGKPRSFWFLTRQSAAGSGLVMAGFAIDTLRVSRFAVLYDASDPLAVLSAGAFRSYAGSRGAAIAFFEAIEPEDSETDRRIAAAKQASAGLFICGSSRGAALAVARACDSGVYPLILGGEPSGFSNPRAAVFPRDFSLEESGLKKIAGRFSARYGRAPRPEAFLGWNDCAVVLEALRRAGSTDPLKVRDALEQVSGLPGAAAPITMDAKTHGPRDLPMAVFRVENGKESLVAGRFVAKRIPRGQ